MYADLYHARLLDHAKHPRNKCVLEHATAVVPVSNSSCGDALTLYLAVRDERIAEVSFTGEGCAVSQAAASLLTEKVRGMEIRAAAALTEADVCALLGTEIAPARRTCAFLALKGLSRALSSCSNNTEIDK